MNVCKVASRIRLPKASPQAQDGVKYKDGHLEGLGVIL